MELCWCEAVRKVSVDEMRHGEMAHLSQGWADTAIDWTTGEATECWEGIVQRGVVEWWSYSCKHSDLSLSPLPLDLFLTRPHIFSREDGDGFLYGHQDSSQRLAKLVQNFQKHLYFYNLCVWRWYVYIWVQVYTRARGIRYLRTRVADACEPWTWVLGVELGPHTWAVSTFSHWNISTWKFIKNIIILT